jgi:hypothetical protein
MFSLWFGRAPSNLTLEPDNVPEFTSDEQLVDFLERRDVISSLKKDFNFTEDLLSKNSANKELTPEFVQAISTETFWLQQNVGELIMLSRFAVSESKPQAKLLQGVPKLLQPFTVESQFKLILTLIDMNLTRYCMLLSNYQKAPEQRLKIPEDLFTYSLDVTAWEAIKRARVKDASFKEIACANVVNSFNVDD